MADAASPNVIPTKSRVPHTAGDFTPVGGGRYLPIVLNSWPIKPSGVQLARPIIIQADEARLGERLRHYYCGGAVSAADVGDPGAALQPLDDAVKRRPAEAELCALF